MDQILTWIIASPIEKTIQDIAKIRMIFWGAVLTSPLMFSYAWIAQVYITDPTPALVGWIASLVHLFSPLLTRFTKNYLAVISVLLLAGLTHQATFAFYSGGFHSPIIIWFAVLPVIAGVVTDWRGTLIWTLISTSVASFYAIVEIFDYHFPVLISETGLLLAQGLIAFGMIFLNAFLIYLFVQYSKETQHELQNKNTSISDLIRILIHDITNPLLAADIRLRKLQKGNLSLAQSQQVEKALRSLATINDIAQSVRSAYIIENEPLKITFQDTSINSLIKEVLESFEQPLTQKEIIYSFETDLPDNFKARLNAISIKHQVISNIISNAIKFSEHSGRIKIKTTTENHHLIITIQDFGLGIPKPILANLFNVEYNKQRTGTEGEQGTGFGMHLAHQTILAHDGQIEVISVTKEESSNTGTTFKITLPLVDTTTKVIKLDS